MAKRPTSPALLQLAWFKRDLRVEDHHVLTRAAEHGPPNGLDDLDTQADLAGWQASPTARHQPA